jgi:hypothetical protein
LAPAQREYRRVDLGGQAARRAVVRAALAGRLDDSALLSAGRT